MSQQLVVQRGGGLTAMQAAYVKAIMGGLGERAALDVAGYNKSTSVYEVGASPAVQAALRTARTAAITGDLAALALEAMKDLLTPETPSATRLGAAKWVLEHGKGEHDDDDRAPSDMTGAQLDAFIARAEAALAEAPPIIDVTPTNGALR